jgi:hypothetical protein
MAGVAPVAKYDGGELQRSRAHFCAAFGYVRLVAIPGPPLLACRDAMEWGTERQIVKYASLGAAVFIGR